MSATAACYRKKRYSTIWIARQAVKQSKQRGTAGSNLHPYWCRDCSCFHLGHSAR